MLSLDLLGPLPVGQPEFATTLATLGLHGEERANSQTTIAQSMKFVSMDASMAKATIARSIVLFALALGRPLAFEKPFSLASTFCLVIRT